MERRVGGRKKGREGRKYSRRENGRNGGKEEEREERFGGRERSV